MNFVHPFGFDLSVKTAIKQIKRENQIGREGRKEGRKEGRAVRVST
jgi:hypothetical protein